MFDPRPPHQAPLPGMAYADEPPFLPHAQAGSDARLSHYLLFFALLPPPSTAQQAFQLANRLREQHGLPQKAMPAARMHVTLQPVVAFAEAVPRLIVNAAIQAAAGVAPHCRSLPISFARVGSMGPHAPTALALQCSADSTRAISGLRAVLARSLQRHGFELAPHRVPHMTLVYGAAHVAAQEVEPLHWTATRLVLILSHHGLGHHDVVAQWPLLNPEH